jgi:hypothetical protein
MRKKKTGAVRSKKVKHDGIEFQSKLELYCYKKLKTSKLSFDYEGHRFEVLESFKHEGFYGKKAARGFSLKENKLIRAVTYTPDFVSHKHKFVIETKGFVPSNHSFPLRFKMFLLHLKNNSMGDYDVYIPRNQKEVDEVVIHIVDKM